MESAYDGNTVASPCFCAIPSLPWHVPHVFGTLSAYTAERLSSLGKMECALPWQLVQGCSAPSECTLPASSEACPEWHVSHFTLAILSGCGYPLMSAWQALQPRLP